MRQDHHNEKQEAGPAQAFLSAIPPSSLPPIPVTFRQRLTRKCTKSTYVSAATRRVLQYIFMMILTRTETGTENISVVSKIIQHKGNMEIVNVHISNVPAVSAGRSINQAQSNSQ
ncbi:hypothetical protein NGRA_2772 [Nosema granulosis]|uniref:Uncharacterized protein n=1 Tax=Nosema granulosis TaxID=83296 RepID=A0A9P6KXT4_9MICR|nr:hypothetical protein NGRA_2772 [Nosema granulosis]